MTDSTPRRTSARSSGPEPTVFDPRDGGPLPGELQARATVVLLLGCSADRAWAAETALELSGAWAEAGRRVVLADLHLENPRLHELAGVSNLEGVVDVFLYGASIARSARPVPGRKFFLITAGTYEPDADAIYRHPRWPKLVTGFREAGATLVLFAPIETAELDLLARWVEQAVVLGERADAPRRLVEHGIAVSAVMIPDAPPAPAEQEEPQLPPAAPAPPPTEIRVTQAAPPPVDPPPADAATVAPRDEDPELMLPPAPVRPPRRSRRGAYVALGVVLVALLLAGAGFLLARYRPDLLPGARTALGPDTVATALATPPAPPQRAAAALPYSVQVIAYQSLPAALERLASQRSQLPDVLFFISPEEIDSLLYYKILAGALPDTVAAKSMREQLVAAGAIEQEDAVGAWSLIQHTPLAFDLGEFEQEATARAVADSLSARQLPAYVLPVAYSRGDPRWQVYAGAYPDSASADALRRQLGAAGEAPRLVPRVGGTVPSGAPAS